MLRVTKKNLSPWTEGWFRTVRNDAGFTLVEVLIAAMILFSALTVGTLAYRTSVLALQKTTNIAVISGALPDIMAEIRSRLMEKADKGEGRFNAKITYAWQAEKVRSSKNVVGFSELEAGLAYGSFQVTLQDVALTLTYAFEGVKKEEKYAYQELVWHR